MIMKTMGIVHTLIVFSLLTRVRSRWKSRSIAPSRKIDSHQEIKYRADNSSASLAINYYRKRQESNGSRADFSFRRFFLFEVTADPDSPTSRFFNDARLIHIPATSLESSQPREPLVRRPREDRWISLRDTAFNDIRLETCAILLLLLYYIKKSSRSLSIFRTTSKKWNFFPAAYCKVAVPRDVGFIESDFVEIIG